ncbi:glycosyltransferase [Teichococcus aestuarii]|uniref:glycosyltransferase n=1 Tax=Teichococcus aestuarii TaxID=568898 RepID=UPI00360B7861
MRIIITNIRLDQRSGTEIVTSEVARGLVERGHQVAVYVTSPLGGLAIDLRKAGVLVTERIEALSHFDPDILHGHHTTPFLIVRTLFPEVPALWFCHDAISWHDEPPVLNSIGLYVAHSIPSRNRILASPGIDPARVYTLHNASGLPFQEAPPPAQLRRVLVVAKYNAQHVNVVREACQERGLDVEIVGGGVGRLSSTLHKIFEQNDLVVTSGKAAMEAICANRPVLCADENGIAGLITPDVATSWFLRNFGSSIRRLPSEAASVSAELDLYNPEDFARTRTLLRPHLALSRYLDELEALYQQIAGHRPKDERLDFARALEMALPSFRIDGPLLPQSLDWKNKAEVLAAELLELKWQNFSFGDKPDARKLSFTINQLGQHALEEGWSKNDPQGTWLAQEARLTLPSRTNWSDFDGIKLEGALDLPACVDAPDCPLHIKANGTDADIKIAPDMKGKRQGYFYLWFAFPKNIDRGQDLQLQILIHGQRASTSEDVAGPKGFRLVSLHMTGNYRR